ncbi:MAG: hypothetical protein LBI87_08530 [Candidatus Accumulibacter sp.]|nr:hypothetical protein [Accumulibacter sp.]
MPEAKGPFFDITAYGAIPYGDATANTLAINNAIEAASRIGGGTVVIPPGRFKVCSIHLKSDVGIHFSSADSVLQAGGYSAATGGEECVYDNPEVNLWIGIQDYGHSHFKNSMMWGIDVKNILISGPGLIEGGYVDPVTGRVVEVLNRSDQQERANRTEEFPADWSKTVGANKAIALFRSENIVMRDFKISMGGHFGIIGTEVVGWTMDNLVIDGPRDALDVDSSQDVTISNSVFNAPGDDALVLKASFGGGRFFPTKNVLIENCTVSGYDIGSVLSGAKTTYYSSGNGPFGRIKLGTEGTNGFDTVTIRNVTFEHSKGFTLQSVDGAELKNIVFVDSVMRDIFLAPIHVVLGDRGRAPVTGTSTDEAYPKTGVTRTADVRLDDPVFVMPNLPKYGNFPIIRYVPSYNKNHSVTIGGGTNPTIVNPTAPTRLNPVSAQPNDPRYANAVGAPMSKVYNIKIDNIKITDVDPRHAVIIAGLVDNPVENVTISNVSIAYRGGLKMEHAIEQRRLYSSYTYPVYGSPGLTGTASIAWLYHEVPDEMNLPRIYWDTTANAGAGGWKDDPYNIPEAPRVYPEPTNWGVLPAYGLWARHVKGLKVDNVKFSFEAEDERPAVVLDDVDTASFTNFSAQVKTGTPVFVTVTHTKKRPPVFEYVLDEPYKTTTVSNLSTPAGMAIEEVTISRPEPGTPPDSLYALPTAPSDAHPYSFAVPNASYPYPRTVWPHIQP